MGETWRMNLIVGLLLGGVCAFIIYVMVTSRIQEREDREKKEGKKS